MHGESKTVQLPQTSRIELEGFLDRLGRITYLKPNADLDTGCRVFYGNSWNQARSEARKELAKSIGKGKWDPEWASAWLKVIEIVKFGEIPKAVEIRLRSAIKDEREVTWDIELDIRDSANLMALLIASKDLDFEGRGRYLDHAIKRMKVWEMGYGLAGGDAEGILYVYCKGKPLGEPAEQEMLAEIRR